MRRLAGVLAAGTFALASPALAAGNLAANGEDLPELKIDTAALAFSQTEYQLETGKYYRLVISSDGIDQISWAAPDLWRNSWINQISVEDISIIPTGLDSLSFEDASSVEVSFVPIRPGEYTFFSPGYEKRGLKGKFVVK